MTIETAITRVVATLIGQPAARRVTYILSPTVMICSARRTKYSKRDKSIEMVLTIGRPNFMSRRLIAQARRAGESFPIKKLQFSRAM